MAREEQRVATTRVVEEEVEGFAKRGCFRDKFEGGPDYEAEEDRVECVAGVGEEGHD